MKTRQILQRLALTASLSAVAFLLVAAVLATPTASARSAERSTEEFPLVAHIIPVSNANTQQPFTTTAGTPIHLQFIAVDEFYNLVTADEKYFTWTLDAGGFFGGTWYSSTVAGLRAITATSLLPSMPGVSATAHFSVATGPAAYVSITPNYVWNPGLAAGENMTFTAWAFDSGGNDLQLPASSFTWEANYDGHVSPLGVYSSTVPGGHPLWATYDNLFPATAFIVIYPGPTAVVSVNLSSDQILVGEQVRASVDGWDVYGNQKYSDWWLPPISWTITGPESLTLDIASDGVVTPTTPGYYTFTATVDGTSGSSSVDVMARPLDKFVYLPLVLH